MHARARVTTDDDDSWTGAFVADACLLSLNLDRSPVYRAQRMHAAAVQLHRCVLLMMRCMHIWPVQMAVQTTLIALHIYVLNPSPLVYYYSTGHSSFSDADNICILFTKHFLFFPFSYKKNTGQTASACYNEAKIGRMMIDESIPTICTLVALSS